jgi:Carboxypeptidase regulatory-like domain
MTFISMSQTLLEEIIMRQKCIKMAPPAKALVALLAALLTIGLSPGLVGAQVLYGSLIGNVTDQNGAVVPGATVTIINKGTGQTREAATNESGEYSITNILAGDYDVKVTKQGFTTFTQTNLKITTNNVTRVDVQIKVGNVADVVSVTADQTFLQSDTAEVKSQLTTKEITDLPTNQYRNYQALINLVPGATPAAFQNAITDTPARSLRTFVNGTNPNSNTTRLDGAINVFIWLPHHNVYVAPVETVQEVSITTDSFDAEQGFAGGAAISVQTKSGGNQFHGSAFAFHNNQHFNAKNFFFPAKTKLNKSITNIDGGTFSGPIKRDKLFFFGSWEGTRERVGRFNILNVPTAEMRNGNFAGLGVTLYDPRTTCGRFGNPACARNAQGQEIITRQQFTNPNAVPTGLIDPIAKKVLDMIPLPNLPGDSPGVRNYFVSGSEALNRDNFDVKINWNRTPAQQIWGKFSSMDAQVIGLPSFGDAVGPPLGGLAGTGDTKVYLTTVGQTWTINKFVVDGNFGYTRMDQVSLGSDFGKNFGSEVLGIPGTNGSDPRQSGFPLFQFGFSDVGQTAGWSPAYRNDRSYTGAVNVGHVRGPHDMRFGFDTVYHQLNHWQPEILNGPRGALIFNGQAVLPGSGSPNRFHQLAQFLLGYTSSVNNTLQYELMTGREWQFGWYFRDRWQVTRNLTATLGLRYEYYPLMTRANRGLERLDLNTLDVLLGGVGGNPTNLDLTTSKKLFAPRIGFAYRLGDNTVIRSGYGITYDPIPFSRPLRGFYPLTIAQQFDADAFLPLATIKQGIPPVVGPDLSTGRVHLPSNVDERTPAAGQIHRGYIQSWNLMVERKLPGDFTTSLGYVGTQTTHQLADLNINAADVGRGNAGRPFSSKGLVRTLNLWDGYLSSNYHALQASVNRRFTRGLYVKSAYTWSKAINMTDEDGWASVGYNSPSQFSRNRALAGYDRTHMFTFGSAYELPFGKGKTWAPDSKVVSALVGGWQINGVFSAYSGTPFTVSAGSASCNCPGNSQTADLVKTDIGVTGNHGAGTPFFDVLAFRDPARTLSAGQFRYGTTGRNAYRGPGYWNLDFSLFRRFALTERFKMDFRTEAYNIFNHPQFGNPGANVSNLTFKPDGSINTLGGFGEITSTVNSERKIRFALRLEF